MDLCRKNRVEDRFLVQMVKKIAENKERRVYLYTNNVWDDDSMYR